MLTANNPIMSSINQPLQWYSGLAQPIVQIPHLMHLPVHTPIFQTQSVINPITSHTDEQPVIRTIQSNTFPVGHMIPPQSEVPLMISKRANRRIHNPELRETRNYSAEWAACHPEILYDFFVRYPRRHGASFKKFENQNVAKIRTITENVRRKGDEREKRRKKEKVDVKERHFDWKPRETENQETNDKNEIRKDKSNSISPITIKVPSPPLFDSHSKKEESAAEEVHGIKDMIEQLPKPPGYVKVVSEITGIIDKYKSGNNGDNVGYMAPSSLGIKQRRKPPQVEYSELDIANKNNLFLDSPAVHLRHVSPPRTPQYGSVATYGKVELNRSPKNQLRHISPPRTPQYGSVATYGQVELNRSPKNQLRHVSPPRTPQYGRVKNVLRTPQPSFIQPKPQIRPSMKTSPQFNSYKLEEIEDIDETFENDVLERLKYMNFTSKDDGVSKKYLASDGTEWDVFIVGSDDDEMKLVDRILTEENAARLEDEKRYINQFKDLETSEMTVPEEKERCENLPPDLLQTRLCRPKASTKDPHRQRWGVHIDRPSLKDTAILVTSSVRRVPTDARGTHSNHAPDSRVETANSLARTTPSREPESREL
ncbi:hypothetical protein ACOME3_005413 [Neoechinorhynchus agilis]